MQDRFEKNGFSLLPEIGEWQDLTVYKRKSVALIALLRLKEDKRAARQAGNNLDDRLMGEMRRVLDILESRTDISSIIIASQHNLIYSIGAKIEVVLGIGFEEALQFVEGAQKLILKLMVCKKPIVAAINGWAFGGGLEIAMACDYRIAGDGNHVLLGLPETSLGLIPGMAGTQNLPRLVGLEKARDYMLSAKVDIDPVTAKNNGLLDEMVPQASLIEKAFAVAIGALRKTNQIDEQTAAKVDRNQVRSEIRNWLDKWTNDRESQGRAAPLAQAMIHFVLEKTSRNRFFEALVYEQEAFAYLATTADSQEGVRAMLEEREPVFRGR
jgi:enoyl-CoA hydratase/carnithine racemase